MADSTASGAAQGAMAGASLGPWGAVAGGVLGGISGFMSGKKEARARAEEKARQERIRQIASPQHLDQLIQHFQPLFREIVASGLGPQFQTAVADNLAKHGMTGTGVGEAFRTAGKTAPAIFATKAATEEAGSTVQRQLSAEGIAGPPPAQASNPLLDAILGGARGAFSMSSGTSAPKSTGDVLAGVSNPPAGTPTLPNITPAVPPGTFPPGYTPNVFSR